MILCEWERWKESEKNCGWIIYNIIQLTQLSLLLINFSNHPRFFFFFSSHVCIIFYLNLLKKLRYYCCSYFFLINHVLIYFLLYFLGDLKPFFVIEWNSSWILLTFNNPEATNFYFSLQQNMFWSLSNFLFFLIQIFWNQFSRIFS